MGLNALMHFNLQDEEDLLISASAKLKA
jgi:hypothetical protein